MKKTIQLSLISVALLSSLHADNQYTLETINVTSAQGTTLSKKDVTDSVTIITKEAIEESRVTTLAEALSKLGNLATTQSGGVGQQSSLFVRGMDAKRVLILIDGVRYNNPTTPGAAAEFDQIMLYNVEQIEIIKGAQSGVWGADASAGVINIITSKAKTGVHAVGNVEYGSFNTLKVSAQTSYATEQYNLSIGALQYTTDGISAFEPFKESADYGKRYDTLGLEKDAYSNKSLNAKLGVNITEQDKVEASVQTINTLVDFDGWQADSEVENTKLQNRFYIVAYKHTDALHDLTLQYNLSTFDRTSEFLNWSGVGIDSYAYKGSVNEFKLDDKIVYMQNSFVRVGASYQKFEQEDITTDTDKSFAATSAFATNYNKFSIFTDQNTILTESVRFDRYDNFNDALSGKIGLKQFIKDDLYISANLGTGYNTPTLSQLYGQYGANPNLKPEKSLTSDITFGNDMLWITAFANEITDFIDYDMSTWAYVQAEGKSKFEGLELGYQDYFFDALGVNAMYTYVKTQDAEGETLARRPKTQLDAKATYYLSDTFDLGVSAQYIGTRYDGANDGGAQTGEYTTADFVANLKANNFITFYGKVNNLGDKYYQTVDGYATAGRSLFIGMNAKY
ncbi:MAG: TonB-dependent receptor [Sulfurimonas sp.]|nr:TonB-dependent receptor [Sulfurimonas sp.]